MTLDPYGAPSEAQKDTIKRLAKEHGASRYIIDYDEPTDSWFYLTLFTAEGKEVLETVIEQDGTPYGDYEDDDG